MEFSVEYFLFIPLTLAMLFDPMSAALGAATGELVFSEIMLGQFGGLGELEKFITVTIGVYIAGRLVSNPQNRKLVGIAAFGGTAIQLLLGTIVDILKVQFAIEDFESVAGLPESVFATEGFAFVNDLLFSGILFCLLPTLFLVPKLYGKIEPLLGMQPRTKNTALDPIGLKAVLGCAVAFAVAIGAEFMAESGLSLIDWEADWAESSTAMAIGMVVAAVLAVAVADYESPPEKAPLEKGGVSMMNVIEIDHLTYSYPGAEQPTLKDITVKIKKGTFSQSLATTAAGSPLL